MKRMGKKPIRQPAEISPKLEDRYKPLALRAVVAAALQAKKAPRRETEAGKHELPAILRPLPK
ncbi:hypothetical protein KYK29_12430 [Shinella daejeonensis]|uniref:hypothetical protein n=1 Tax=Shinella daejeonensis TaxID=659017 RepID=UPI0020C7E1FC|nr:hypothetical protein [Shinella daejeonensis]MCP8895729.1 hypothetical protein [Shinella daejeonensis]